MRILLVDNYDSFTYNLFDYVLRTGVGCTVVRNDRLPDLKEIIESFSGILLSPGPKKPADAGGMPDLIRDYSDKIPMLGVCLGHQALGTYFGADLVRAPEPVHGKRSKVRCRRHAMFEGIPTDFQVMRYHSLALTGIERTPLEPLAYTKDGVLMAFAHRTLPLWGVQFHPESVGTPHGLRLIQNWTKYLADTRR